MALFERGGLFEDGLYMTAKKNLEYKYNKIGLYFEILRGGIISRNTVKKTAYDILLLISLIKCIPKPLSFL